MWFDVINLKARRCSAVSMAQTHDRLDVSGSHSAQWELAEK
jgi:hypothetical protein